MKWAGAPVQERVVQGVEAPIADYVLVAVFIGVMDLQGSLK